MKTPIYDSLQQLTRQNRIPFHMPGHKRTGDDAFAPLSRLDITEIRGFDNLHNPEGIIRESMDALKKVYHTRESWYLVNGSTAGILAAISSVCGPGDGILFSRNCHRSVYHAARLLRLTSYYFQFSLSEDGGFCQSLTEQEEGRIRRLLKNHPSIRMIVFPSPSYEGVVFDVERFQKMADECGVVLLVDEAHGAHLMFHPYFPESAVNKGADLVVQSVHKTLPALTQTALLHLCSDKVSPAAISDMLAVYETSSPSYLLLASAETAVRTMTENEDKIREYVDNLADFRAKCGQLHHIHLMEKEDLACFDYDNSKLVFTLNGAAAGGIQLFNRLYEKYGIELEMAQPRCCVAMTSVCDTKEMYARLFSALQEIDASPEFFGASPAGQQTKSALPGKKKDCLGEGISSGRKADFEENVGLPEKIWEPWACQFAEKETVSLQDAVGRVSGNYVLLYPPGSPLLVPGEKIDKEMVENIRYYLYNGYNVPGLSGEELVVLRDDA